MKRTLIAATIAALIASMATAFANYFYRDGTGALQQFFSFVCQGTTVCPGQVLINSSGVARAMPPFVSAGAGQFGLAVGSNTQLSVPGASTCAFITVEGANIRRTSDGTSATSSNGTLIQQGSQWQDCGPLSAYKFTAVTGSPMLDVEYFQ